MARRLPFALAALALMLGAPALAAPARTPRTPVTLAALTGASEADARARLGAPDIARAEGLGALWTYRLKDCALLVFFRKQEGGPLRVSGAVASPRRRGETPPSVDVCLAGRAATARQPGRDEVPVF